MEDDQNTSILHIIDVTASDSGTIRCFAFLPEEENLPPYSQHNSDSKQCALNSRGESNAHCVAAPSRNNTISCSVDLSVVENFENICEDNRLSSCESVSLDTCQVRSVECAEGESVPVSDENTNTMRDVSESKEPAVLIMGPKDTTALVGDRVLLKATYIGHPEPRIRWCRAVSNHVFIPLYTCYYAYASSFSFVSFGFLLEEC